MNQDTVEILKWLNSNQLWQLRVKTAHNDIIDEIMLNCKVLLRANAERGGEKMPHCNAMIRECIGYIEEILREKGKLR